MDVYNDEKTLIKAISCGNKDAFEYIFKRYYQRLTGFGRRYIQDTEVVQDIVQDCFAVLWEKHSSVSLLSVSVSSFLFAMVRNGCLNHIKHEQVIQKYEIEYQSFAEGEERLYHIDFGLEVEHKLLYEELKEKITQVVDQLPERCREVFIRIREEKQSYAQVAEELGISTKTVDAQLQKATGRLTEMIIRAEID